MDLFWGFILSLAGGVFAGGILMFFFYFLITMIYDWIKIKKKLPKEKGKVTEYIEANREFFLSKKAEEINKKEEEEDDRRRQQKFREFEKLRRSADTENGTRKKPASNSLSSGERELQRQELLQNELSSSPKRTNRKLKLD